jgi:PKHD-type hydroxylase
MFWFEPPDQQLPWTYSFANALDDIDIEFIEQYVANNQNLLQKATIDTGKNNPTDNYRNTDIMWLTDMNSLAPIYTKIIDRVKTINAEHFKYSINYVEPLQYSVYNATDNGKYDMHNDTVLRNTSGNARKLSFSILLNDASEFEGGELEFYTARTPSSKKLDKGTIIVFPSFLMHGVTTVTKGSRRSLVGFVGGPNFV